MTEVLVSRAGAVVELRLDRAAKKNALTPGMYAALAGALRDARSDDAVRAVLLTASGETFCAGNDIGDFLTRSAEGAVAPSAFIEALVEFDKPLVAAVQGPAVGIGATMLLHCDLVYASASTRLRMPFVSLGLVPEAGSSLLLPRRVGDAIAAEILLLGAWIDADRARELRLVNAVLPSTSELTAFARARTVELASSPPGALRATRDLVRGDRVALRERVREEARVFAQCLTSREAKEALSAFLERRPPDFAKR
jgi:enoyl-CoA hydratase/carnithine racemase